MCVTGGSNTFWMPECHTPHDPPLCRGTIQLLDSGTARTRLACSTALACEAGTVELSLTHLRSTIWCAGVRVPPLPPMRRGFPTRPLLGGHRRSLHRTVHLLAFAPIAGYPPTRSLSRAGRDLRGVTGPCGSAGRCRIPSPLRRSPGAIHPTRWFHG